MSSASLLSLGLSGGWSSLKIPGDSSPLTSPPPPSSDISLRSESELTFRFDCTESVRLTEMGIEYFGLFSDAWSYRYRILTILVKSFAYRHGHTHTFMHVHKHTVVYLFFCAHWLNKDIFKQMGKRKQCRVDLPLSHPTHLQNLKSSLIHDLSIFPCLPTMRMIK